eukprot:9149424-Karenia_brevis.AAC.1
MPTAPSNRDCWEEVMVEFEGPHNPKDKDGCAYVMTYICCLCQRVLLEPVKRTSAAEVRRAFACCLFRSGTIPLLVRSDRGSECKNVLMSEYSSFMGIGYRFGTQWRPMEQGLVESKHQETQKIMGIRVRDVCQCFPNETGELLR